MLNFLNQVLPYLLGLYGILSIVLIAYVSRLQAQLKILEEFEAQKHKTRCEHPDHEEDLQPLLGVVAPPVKKGKK